MKTLSNWFSRAAGAALLMVAAVAGAADTAGPDGKRPGLLKALDGNWIMAGDVRGKPVTYRMNAASALQGNFTEMRMKDVQEPARYEAVVFLGHDAASKTVIAHWMDSFGPKFSIPHGTGHIDGNTIQFVFPYQSGKFRNTWTYDPATSSWTFALESGLPDGSWKHFARYQVTRD